MFGREWEAAVCGLDCHFEESAWVIGTMLMSYYVIHFGRPCNFRNGLIRLSCILYYFCVLMADFYFCVSTI